jgi:hypothetical protein
MFFSLFVGVNIVVKALKLLYICESAVLVLTERLSAVTEVLLFSETPS